MAGTACDGEGCHCLCVSPGAKRISNGLGRCLRDVSCGEIGITKMGRLRVDDVEVGCL